MVFRYFIIFVIFFLLGLIYEHLGFKNMIDSITILT